MVLEKNYLTSVWPIANWWFEDENTPVSAIGIEEFTGLLVMCEKCLLALSAYQLLVPTNVILSGAWTHYDELGRHLGSINKNEINIEFPRDGSSTFKDVVLSRVLSNQIGEGFVYPASFEVRG